MRSTLLRGGAGLLALAGDLLAVALVLDALARQARRPAPSAGTAADRLRADPALTTRRSRLA